MSVAAWAAHHAACEWRWHLCERGSRVTQRRVALGGAMRVAESKPHAGCRSDDFVFVFVDLCKGLTTSTSCSLVSVAAASHGLIGQTGGMAQSFYTVQ